MKQSRQTVKVLALFLITTFYNQLTDVAMSDNPQNYKMQFIQWPPGAAFKSESTPDTYAS